MMFSTRAEYGVRVMVELGRRRGQGPVSLAEIAGSEGLPLSYLEHLVASLRKAELVSSTRGAHGGYELGRPPAEITMAEVVHALEGTVVPMQCFTEPASGRVLCNHELDGYAHCATRLLWTRVQGGVTRALESTTLAELVEFAAHGAAPKRKAAPKGRAKVASPTTVGPGRAGQSAPASV
jgi:Rrf2 family transcriptional regulator, cysteine metabolism repressor